MAAQVAQVAQAVKNTRVEDVERILKGFSNPFPKISSAAATTVIGATTKNLGSVIQKSTASFGIGTPSFSAYTSSSTIKYVSYVLLGIVTFIALILFLQSIGINVIKQRSGADGLIPSPLKDSSMVIFSDLYGTGVGSKFNYNKTMFTVNIPILIKSNITNYTNSVPILLFYHSSNTANSNLLSNTVGTSGASNASTDIIDYFNTTNSLTPFQLAVYLDGNSKDLCVDFYCNNPEPPPSNPVIKSPSTLLKNPPLDVLFNLTIVVSNYFVEVYSNGKLTKTTVFSKGIFYDSNAKFYIPTNTDITITENTVAIWNTALSANEISKLDILQSNTPIKSAFSKFWKLTS